jgi:hypothetical protein
MPIVSAEFEQRFAYSLEQVLKIGRFFGQRAIELFAYLSGTGVRIEAAIAKGAKIFRHQFNGGICHATDLVGWRVE